MRRIITISREFGSGGRELGRRLAEALQIAYYDQEIVTELIERTGFALDYVKQAEERIPVPLLPITTARTFGIGYNSVVEQQLSIYNHESDIIRELAEKSDCLIVGRCADYVLRDMDPFRIFVYADIDSKLARCREKGPDAKNMSDRELRQKISSVDKKRSRYYQFYTDNLWGDKENYDLCVNTSSKDIKKLSVLLAEFIKGI
ncbi:MAG TPA: cytidylate kinase-like family protein [Candidatus Avilachnospira avistercoris]|nr:cytidylate kinase-like family protein [Candidatus Avilachnospira avistercoris]